MAEKFLQKAEERMEEKGTKGLFGRKAKAAGMSTQAYARKEKGAGGKLGKEANFALTAGKIAKGKR